MLEETDLLKSDNQQTNTTIEGKESKKMSPKKLDSSPVIPKQYRKSKQNITIMIVMLNLLFIFTNVTLAMSTISSVQLAESSILALIASIVSTVLLYVGHGFCFFIYLKCDKRFYDTFSLLFLKKKLVTTNK